MVIPGPSQAWLDTVSLAVDLAIHHERAHTTLAEPSLEQALAGALADRTLGTSRLAHALGLTAEEQLAAWCLIAGQLSTPIATRLEALSGAHEVTLGTLCRIAYASCPARAIAELGSEGRLARSGLVESADDPRGSMPSWAAPYARRSDCSDQRGALWLRALGQGSETDREHLASRYPLAPAMIVRAAEAAKAICPGALTAEAIYAGIRRCSTRPTPCSASAPT